MKIIKHIFVAGILIPVGVLFLMVLADLVRPYKPPQGEVETSFKVYPETQDDWGETAHSLGVHRDSLTIQQYLAHINQPSPSKEESDAKLREYVNNR